MDVAASIERGMRAQLGRLGDALARGTPRLGWKIAINDPAVQRRMGLEAPLVGVLDGARSRGSGGELALSPGAIAKVEAEVSIRVGRDVSGAESGERARSAIAALAPAIEVVDYAKPSESLEAILSHAAFHVAAVFGDERPAAAVDLAGLGVEWPRLFKNDELARAPARELRPQSLEAIVALVARTLERHGERLREGDRILSGAFTQPIGVQAGDRVRVEAGPLGPVELSVS
jgi:2-oxo-3-hexenedioate decarboxylase